MKALYKIQYVHGKSNMVVAGKEEVIEDIHAVVRDADVDLSSEL